MFKTKTKRTEFRLTPRQKAKIVGGIVLSFFFGISCVVNGYYIQKGIESIQVKVSDTNTPKTAQKPLELENEAQEIPIPDPCGLDVVICDGEKQKANISTYNAEEGQTDADPLTMASGKQVFEGAIANNCLPFGTKVHFEGLGVFEVQDRMNSRYGCEQFDIFKWEREDNFSKKGVEYAVLK